jgi:hypothetical protein
MFSGEKNGASNQVFFVPSFCFESTIFFSGEIKRLLKMVFARDEWDTFDVWMIGLLKDQ